MAEIEKIIVKKMSHQVSETQKIYQKSKFEELQTKDKIINKLENDILRQREEHDIFQKNQVTMEKIQKTISETIENFFLEKEDSVVAKEIEANGRILKEALSILQVFDSKLENKRTINLNASALDSNSQRLNDLESCIKTIRKQSIEDREMLTLECDRLISFQKSLIKDRKENDANNRIEMERLANRWAAFELEKRKAEEELIERRTKIGKEEEEIKKEYSEITMIKQHLEENFIENREILLKKEEQMFLSRKELLKEVTFLEQKKESARVELKCADATRLELCEMRAALEHDTNKKNSQRQELMKMGKLITKKKAQAELKSSENENIKTCIEKLKSEIKVERIQNEVERRQILSKHKTLIHNQATNIRKLYNSSPPLIKGETKIEINNSDNKEMLQSINNRLKQLKSEFSRQT